MPAGQRSHDGGNYHAFLVRVSRADANHPWVTVAKDVETGEEYPLRDPADLIQFLSVHLPVFRPAPRGAVAGQKKP